MLRLLLGWYIGFMNGKVFLPAYLVWSTYQTIYSIKAVLRMESTDGYK